MTSNLDQRLQSFIGRGGDWVTSATDRVSIEAIRQATNVVGDRNIAYRDSDIADGTLLAPPSSVLWWHRPYLEPVAGADFVDDEGVRRFRLDPNPIRQRNVVLNENGVLAELMQLLAEAGFASIVVTNAVVNIARHPRPGDLLSCWGPTIEALSPLKKTALGEGYFSTSAYVLRDERDEEVANWKTTRFHFAPQAATLANDANAAEASRTVPTASVRASAERGELQELPPWIVEVTPTLIVAGAIATRDIQDVHHDRDLAVRRGFRDIFLNNFTSMALVSRYVTDWAGPAAQVRTFSFKLSKPQYPGDHLRFTGRVLSDSSSANGRTVELHVRGDNALGNHIACNLSLEVMPSS